MCYEELCAKPEERVRNVAEVILEQPVDMERIQVKPGRFASANNVKIDSADFEELEVALAGTRTGG